jgi:hypothetical protein
MQLSVKTNLPKYRRQDKTRQDKRREEKRREIGLEGKGRDE